MNRGSDRIATYLTIHSPSVGVPYWSSILQLGSDNEACIGVLGIQDIKGYRILSSLLPGIWDTWLNIFITSRDIENLGKLIMGIFADL